MDLTNKKLSAEKPISKQLADELKMIMEFSTPVQRNKYQPIPEEQFKYQSDVDKNKFEKLCSKQSEQSYAQYPGLLASDDYTNYINDPFNKDKTSPYLSHCHVTKCLEPKVNAVSHNLELLTRA